MAPSYLQNLPVEVKLAIFYSIDDLRTIDSLARASSSLHNTWQTFMVDIYQNLLQHHSYQEQGSQSSMKFEVQVSSPELRVRAAKDLVKLHRLARMICKEPVRRLPNVRTIPDHLLRELPQNNGSLHSTVNGRFKISREVQMRFQRAVCNLCTMAMLSPEERLAFVKKFKPDAEGLSAIWGLWMLLSRRQGDGDWYFEWSTFVVLDMWHRSNSVFQASPFSKMGEGSSCIHYAGFEDIKPKDPRDQYNEATRKFLMLEKVWRNE
ncbi:MAG: hypothetical protein OHK93_003131 [Ramalina farinacea]|uniref:F-box domain-containing protein n=1 Tax=Ramalina farinacea TaxID=258253 RepID=A0AA43QSU0_9LECA|nr:hypothetical protein [Ramalina farinacea]